MTDQRNPQPGFQQDGTDVPARLALAASGAHSTDRDHRLGASEHRGPRAEQGEVRARGEDGRRLVHHLAMRDVGVGEDDLVHAPAGDERRELVLRTDRDPVRIAGSGQRRRVYAIGDARDLRRGEREHLDVRIVAVHDVEVVKVAPAGTHHDHAAHHHSSYGGR